MPFVIVLLKITAVSVFYFYLTINVIHNPRDHTSEAVSGIFMLTALIKCTICDPRGPQALKICHEGLPHP